MRARPTSIVWFERLFLGMIVVSIFRWLLTWRNAPPAADPQSLTPGLRYSIAIFCASVLIQLLLWFFIARRGSAVAKWILVALVLFNLVNLALRIFRGDFAFGANDILVAIAFALYGAAVAFLFRPDAKPWFDRRRDVSDAEIFR